MLCLQAELESSENASDSWGLVGDAFIDSNTIEQANARPQGSKVRSRIPPTAFSSLPAPSFQALCVPQ